MKPDLSRYLPLREVRPEDSPLFFSWINDRELVEQSAPFKPISLNEHERWFFGIQVDSSVRIFAIASETDGTTIGYCQLKKIDRRGGSAELQIRIGDRGSQGKGLGTSAVRRLLAHAFLELGLRKVYLHVFADNDRAYRTYIKCGFQVEGVLRDAVRIDGVLKDIREMAVLRKDYLALAR